MVGFAAGASDQDSMFSTRVKMECEVRGDNLNNRRDIVHQVFLVGTGYSLPVKSTSESNLVFFWLNQVLTRKGRKLLLARI